MRVARSSSSSSGGGVGSFDARTLGSPHVGVPHELRLSHNAAIVCRNDSTIVAYGGRKGHRAPYSGFAQVAEDVGIRRSVGTLVAGAHGSMVSWSRAEPILDGSTASDRGSCVERRGFEHCEFDGKLSAVWRSGDGGGMLLFARANTATQARFVQVTRSADGVTGWSPWQLITFAEGSLAPGKHTNIYYFSVSEVQHGGHHGSPRRLVALFPAALNGAGGIFLATSTDGLAWSAPKRLMPSLVLGGVRTADFPVGGVLASGSGGRLFSIHVQHSVSFGKYLSSTNCRQAGVRDEPYICRYELPEEELGFVEQARNGARLGAC